jgi:hypothetical protein
MSNALACTGTAGNVNGPAEGGGGFVAASVAVAFSDEMALGSPDDLCNGSWSIFPVSWVRSPGYFDIRSRICSGGLSGFPPSCHPWLHGVSLRTPSRWQQRLWVRVPPRLVFQRHAGLQRRTTRDAIRSMHFGSRWNPSTE